MTKTRIITIFKDKVLADIDALSSKLADTVVEGVEGKDAVASESDYGLDGYVISSLLDHRDALLRKRLVSILEKEVIETIDNAGENEDTYVYTLILPEDYEDTRLRSAVRLIHDYLVRGTLADWYTKIGTSYGAELLADAEGIENGIVSTVMTELLRHRPAPHINIRYRRR